MFYVYAIASTSRKFIYVGLTSDLENRLLRHNKGYEKTTKPYAPFILLFTEKAIDRPIAREREKYFKSRSGKRVLYNIMRKKFPELAQYKE